MSKVHDAMRQLEQKGAQTGPGSTLTDLVGALLAELAAEVPEDARLETVRADLLAASRSYETAKKKDIALRFYLATRSLLHECEFLQDRLRKADRRAQAMQMATESAHQNPEPPPHPPMAEHAG